MNVGGAPSTHGATAVSRPSALEGNHHAPSPVPTHIKKCEIFFRSKAILEGTNLPVKSPAPQTLVFILPRKDSNPDEILSLILKTYTYVNSFHHRTFPTSVQFFITVDDIERYEFIRKHEGLTLNGRTYAPIVPLHTAAKLWRVNFDCLPHTFTAEDYHAIFEPYGNIVVIGRYYFAIENNTHKVYTWDGYVILEGKVDKHGQPVECVPVSETIDIEKGSSISTKTVASDLNTLNSAFISSHISNANSITT